MLRSIGAGLIIDSRYTSCETDEAFRYVLIGHARGKVALTAYKYSNVFNYCLRPPQLLKQQAYPYLASYEPFIQRSAEQGFCPPGLQLTACRRCCCPATIV